MRLDWKFIIGTFATLLGVVVSVLLWKIDNNAKSLAVRLVSSTELKSTVTTTIPDLKLTLKGVEIPSPIISIVEVINNGSKPIPANDFESALEVSLNPDSKLIRATLISTEPNDLKPIFEVQLQTIKIQPLLLNPNDKMKFSVLSDRGLPRFSVRSRISGIQAIEIEQEFEEVTRKTKTTMKGIISIFGLILTSLLITNYIRSKLTIESTISMYGAAVLGYFSSDAINAFLKLQNVEESNLWLIFGLIVLLFVFVIPFGFLFIDKSRKRGNL